MALPKTTDPALPSVGGLGYVGEADANAQITTASGNYIQNAAGVWVPVSATNPMPVADAEAIKSAPVTGMATVNATAAEVFAGALRLSGRRKMVIKNESDTLRVRIGSASVTQQNGFPLEPGAVFEVDFDINTDVPIYAIAEGASVEVAVIEY